MFIVVATEIIIFLVSILYPTALLNSLVLSFHFCRFFEISLRTQSCPLKIVTILYLHFQSIYFKFIFLALLLWLYLLVLY